MAKVHEYPVTVVWQGGRDGRGNVTAERTSIQNILAVPPEFGGGHHPGTNPEELLTSAIAGCYSVTYGIIAANRKLPIQSFSMDAVGEVEEQGASFTYKRIVLKPHIVMEPEAGEAEMKAAMDFAHRADNYCIVTNAVRGKVEIVLEPKVEKAG